jgi:CheY-like chemotaxis protein
VLFVDDEPSILEMRRLVFESLGYSVLTAACGEDALEILALYPVDAVVLDYFMPGMDGEETARCIRKVRCDIPIILSSGFEVHCDPTKTRRSGTDSVTSCQAL